jgi:hypothetical protein
MKSQSKRTGCLMWVSGDSLQKMGGKISPDDRWRIICKSYKEDLRTNFDKYF